MSVTYPVGALEAENHAYAEDRERRKAAADEALLQAEEVLQQAVNRRIFAARARDDFDYAQRHRVAVAKAELGRLLDLMPASGLDEVAWDAVPALCDGIAQPQTLAAVAAAWAAGQPGFRAGLLSVLDGPAPDSVDVSRLTDEEHAAERAALLAELRDAQAAEVAARAACDKAALYAQSGWRDDALRAHRARLDEIAVGGELS